MICMIANTLFRIFPPWSFRLVPVTCPIVAYRHVDQVPATYLKFVGFCTWPPITVPGSVRFSDFPIFPLDELCECKFFLGENSQTSITEAL